ncbi:glycoside hydrolase family 38 C-terminal domain-containing protein [Akkermansia sp. N21116]|uniref:glycoside hydrolase family 38 N-terminal domain-containing protein n=1 Tax=Akkermansia sp. N21116 TaxID=3040764 RepID=UPI00244EB841|nr:glycoside hydrolase family 38 C-terminal domain-containing protein [Akkermansia sp. N21116]WPX41037.1 glycoside hydrolase family 38 C-terminal domain-containing protein [Akkermansia sp. N21116]
MKNFILPFFMAVSVFCVSAAEEAPEESLECKITNFYKYRDDHKPGREILVTYKGKTPLQNGSLEISVNGKQESLPVKNNGEAALSVLLPENVGLSEDARVKIDLIRENNRTLSKEIVVPKLRYWNVYIYPHSHVDIGYTNTQDNVEIIHKRNLEYAMQLAEKTKDYPDGARFVWNPEVTWPIERYLATEPREKGEKLLQAIARGQISVDAGYVNTNTSAANEEELLELFRYGKTLEKQTGKKVETMVQVDIPGVSWGVVPAAAHMGIKYCLALFNGSDRTGLAHEINFHPFWWESADGKSKILFLQPGDYTPGAKIKGHMFWPKMAGQTDPEKLLRFVQTDNPRANFIDSYLDKKLPELEKTDTYPYDIFPMTWCIADNTPVDFDLPEAVKSWNAEYAYPKLRICTGTDIMQAFAKKYGDRIPVMKGDFTEYWTDGLGSHAAYPGRNREVKERLLQGETLWSMLNPGKPVSRKTVEEIWRNIILGTEHTWAYMRPEQQPICDEILNKKLDYFRNAEKLCTLWLDSIVSGIRRPSDTICVFNTLSWKRSGLVKLSPEVCGGHTSVVNEETGEQVLCQKLSSGELAFLAENIPPLGAKKFRLENQQEQTVPPVKNAAPVLDNGSVVVKLNPATGDVDSLVHEGQEFADKQAKTAINSFRYLKGADSSDKAIKDHHIKITAREQGPLINTLLIESQAEECSSLSREITVVKGQPAVSFRNTVDKIAVTAKEGVHFGFGFDIPQPRIRADIPWGAMELEKDQLPVANRNWIAVQRWLNISNKNKNITWCSLNAPVFESGDMTANILGGAFGSPKWLRKLEPSATLYSWALNNHWHTNFPLSQQGKIEFKYSVLPAKGVYDAVKSNRFGLEQFQPLIAVPVDKEYECPQNLVISGDDAVMITMVKTINKGVSRIIRLRSVSDKESQVKLTWKKDQPKRVSLCTFNEEPGTSEIHKGNVTIPARGFVTVRADWQPQAETRQQKE